MFKLQLRHAASVVVGVLCCCAVNAGEAEPKAADAKPTPQSEVMVFLKPGVNPIKFGLENGWVLKQRFKSDENAYVYQTPGALNAQVWTLASTKVMSAEPLNDVRVRSAAPNGLSKNVRFFTPNDPYFNKDNPNVGAPGQWHLVNTVGSGIDARVQGAWNRDITGTGVLIGIVDDSFQTTHPDLSPGYSAADSYDFGQNDADPNPVYSNDQHGISVAGVAGARGGNGIGVTGAAPLAGLAGIREDFGGAGTIQQFIDGTLWHSSGGNTNIKVKNHSYGVNVPFYLSTAESNAFTTSTAAGTIHCVAAGNWRGGGSQAAEDANKLDVQNNPDVICVAALGYNGIYSSYSNYGACIFVTTPSNGSTYGITTVDRLGASGYNGHADQDYTNQFGGTSSASPLAAGVIALAKQVQPALTARFAKHMLARTSERVNLADASASSDGGWRQNAAGFWFNQNYGFGLIHANNLCIEAARHTGVTALTTETTTTTAVGAAIPDNTLTGVSRTFNLTSTTPLEEMLVSLSITHQYQGDLEAYLTSPSGYSSRLFVRSNFISGSNINWIFSTNAFWGTNPAGTWTLKVCDVIINDVGTWNSYQVQARMGDVIRALPTVTTIAPTYRTAGDTGFTLTVNGTKFFPNSVIRFNGADQTTTYVNDTQLTCTIAAGDIATAGTKTVTVFTPAPGGGLSNSVNFTVHPTPNITINDVTQNELHSGTSTFGFTVSLSVPSSKTVTVQYATADNTATVGEDYSGISLTTLTFNPGEQTKPVSVTVSGDTKFELTETFHVNLSNASNGTITDSQGVGTITNDDSQPTISIADTSIGEGNSGTGTASFSVTISNASYQAITVQYASADNTATTADGDYVAKTATTLTFNAGTTAAQTATVTVNGDTKHELNDTFHVNLSSPTNATINDGQGVGTITNDDGQPTISIADTSVTEGNSGTVTASFSVTISNASYQAITVQYATADNTATTADSDYVAKTATTLTFNAGTTAAQTATATVNGDTKFELGDTFFVNLSSPTNATINDGQGIGTITNDDTAPTISIADVAVAEGNSGTSQMSLAVTLSNASYQTVTVQYATADNTATTADSDYVAKTATTLTFNPNVTSQNATVTVNGDTKFELNDAFFVNLTSPTNATIADNQSTGTINNDDSQPTISINNVSQAEGNSGTSTATFAVTLSNASYQTITVQYATADNTATSADSDYAAKSATTLTFNPDVTSQNATVTINGDTKFETSETYFVNLSSPSNATIADNQGQGTIANDDGQPTISIADTSVTEGNSGAVTASFNVTISNPSDQTITVQYATADNTATTADSDYVAKTATTLTFPAGSSGAQTAIVTVNGDTKFELNDTFFVNLTSPTNATISDAQGIGTITNDDTQPTISIADAAVVEGDSGTAQLQLSVTISNASYQTITVQYATADDTATVADNDYVAQAATTLTFSAGSTVAQSATVTVNGDALDETDETLLINLLNPVNATIADNQAVGTITNDDAVPAISISDVTVAEGNTGTTQATFTVSMSNPSGKTINVTYATADGTATAGTDYTAVAGTVLTFSPGNPISQQVTVNVAGDTVPEAAETFSVLLSNPVQGTLGDATGVGTITNDDAAAIVSGPTATPNPGRVNEPVQFSCAANGPATWSWTFGDASPVGTGASVSHTYTAAGTYTVTVVGTLTTTGATVSGQVVLEILPPDDGGGGGGGGGLPPTETDSDGDGFSNEVETALGGDPNNASKTPFDLPMTGEPRPLSVSKFGASVNFAKAGADKLQFTGLLPVAAGYSSAGKHVIVDVGGVIMSFDLNAKGQAKSGLNSIKIGVKAKKKVVFKQDAKFAVKGAGSFGSAWTGENLTNATVNGEQRTLLVSVYFNGSHFQAPVSRKYYAKENKSGKLK